MFVRDSINTFIVRCASYGVAFFISIIISNLGQEVKGEVSIVFLVADTIKLICLTGFDAAMVYFLRKGLYDYNTVIRNVRGAVPLFFLGWSLVLFPLVYWLHGIGAFGEIEFKYLAACFVAAPIGSMLDIQINSFIGCGEISRGNTVSLMFIVAYLAALAPVVYFVDSNTWGVLGAYVSAYAISSSIGAWMNRKRNAAGRTFELNLQVIRDLGSWGIRSTAGALARRLAARTDLLLTNLFVTVAAAGIYSVALNWAELALFIPIILQYVLFPHASARERDASIDLTNRTCRASALILLAGAIVVVVAFPTLERAIYTPDYSDAYFPLVLVMPGVCCAGLFRILMGGVDALGKPQLATYASVIHLAATACLSLALVPEYGMVGAACSSSAAGVIAFIALAINYRRASRASYSDFLIIRNSDFGRAKRSFIEAISKVGKKG
jgi:O-antigen/teichoic acid export membrane protein